MKRFLSLMMAMMLLFSTFSVIPAVAQTSEDGTVAVTEAPVAAWRTLAQSMRLQTF